MQFYAVKKIENDLNISQIENVIFSWKINNIISYMDSIRYIDNQTILFFVEINDKIYNFSLNYEKKETETWYLNFIDAFEQSNNTHLKILDMIEQINNFYSKIDSSEKTLEKIMDIVEKAIDEFDFSEDSDNECELSSNDGSITDDKRLNSDIEENDLDIDNPFIDNDDFDDFESVIDYFEKQNIEHNTSGNLYNVDNNCFDSDSDNDSIKLNKTNTILNTESCSENETDSDVFKQFSQKINRKTEQQLLIDFHKLKQHALEIIKEIRNTKNKDSETQLFEPEHIVSIIISEIKQLLKLDNIKLDISDSIYDFKIIYYSVKLSVDIVLQISLSTLEYPIVPPFVNLIKPVITNNFNYSISTMEYFKQENWNPVNSLQIMVSELIKLIEIHGKTLDIRESYSELSNHLISLSIISKIPPKNQFDNNVSLILEIPFVKISYESDEQLKQNEQNNNYNISSEYGPWKAGTGYGSSFTQKWDIKKYLESDKYKLQKITTILSNISVNILKSVTDNTLNPYLINDITYSCLTEFIINSLIDNLDLSYFDNNKVYIEHLIMICTTIFELVPSLFDKYESNFRLSIDNIKMLDSVVKSNNLVSNYIELFNNFIIYFDTNKKIALSNQQISDEPRTIYCNTMKSLQFKTVSELENCLKNDKKSLNIMRIMREINLLSKSLPIEYESSIYVRVDSDNMQCMQAIIIPSHGTPYENGCFLFHIFLPDTFPDTPPVVKFITTGNGTIRFNPNLYVCGKVCLSLLGTWQGDASESWNESSSILQVLISIQSLIFVEQPFFNEPGYEIMINKELGQKSSDEYNKKVQYDTLCWAMVDVLKNPPKGFEEVINNHFKMKKAHIMETVYNWQKKSTSNIELMFLSKYNELCNLLCNLT